MSCGSGPPSGASYLDMQQAIQQGYNQQDIEDVIIHNNGDDFKVTADNFQQLLSIMRGQEEVLESHKRNQYDHARFSSPVESAHVPDVGDFDSPMSVPTTPPNIAAPWDNQSMEIDQTMDSLPGWPPRASRSVDNLAAGAGYATAAGFGQDMGSGEQHRSGSSLAVSRSFEGGWAGWQQHNRKTVAKRPSLERIDSVTAGQQQQQQVAPVDFTAITTQHNQHLLACGGPVAMSSWAAGQQQPQQQQINQTGITTPDEERELAEMAMMFYKPRRRPVNYECHICGQRDDHLIEHCPRKDDSLNLTPYQGGKLCYGEFTCPRCKRNWTSGKSKANTPQQCVKCRVDVMPRKQLELTKAMAKGLLKTPYDADRSVSSSVHSAVTSRCPSRMSLT